VIGGLDGELIGSFHGLSFHIIPLRLMYIIRAHDRLHALHCLSYRLTLLYRYYNDQHLTKSNCSVSPPPNFTLIGADGVESPRPMVLLPPNQPQPQL
jgi:hypothetical protein